MSQVFSVKKGNGEVVLYFFLIVAIILSLFFLYQEGFFQTEREAIAKEEIPEQIYVPLTYSPTITSCSALCYTPPEKQVVKPKVVARRPAYTRVADIDKDAKNPNSIRISPAEAPTILAEVKHVNGRPTCAKKNDKGRNSKKTSKVHIDRECCLDPDEVPNPRCLYL